MTPRQLVRKASSITETVRVAHLDATLCHPVGINASYRAGKGNFWKTPRAKSWADTALLTLRREGFKRLPAGEYLLSFDCTLATKRLDIDAGIKATLDIVAEALGVNDACVDYLCIRKLVVDTTAEQFLRVAVIIERIEEGAA